MSTLTYRKTYLALAIVFWILLTLCNLSIYFSDYPFINPALADFFANYLLCLFILASFLYFKIEIGVQKSDNQDDFLWKVFITGVSTILITLFMRFFIATGIAKGLVLNSILFHINLGLITLFIASTFYVIKKLVLYHKTQTLDIVWHIFEYTTFIAILSSFFLFDFEKLPFYLYISPIIATALYLSFNLKWIALLNYKRKIRSILLMSFTMLITVIYFQQIYEHQLTNDLSIDLWNNVFILGILAFIALYALVAILVLMFHLPTSSVFEKKIEEVKVFQKLNLLIQKGESEEEIYKLLLKSGIQSVDANSGWLEMVDERGNIKAFYNQEIDKIDVFELKKVIRKNHISAKEAPSYINAFKKLSYSDRILSLPYKSAILLPLSSNNQFLGNLVLIKNKANGFDKTANDVLYTFVSQASLAIKNYRLISDALESQRYRETMKIAQEVQKRLLPTNMLLNDLLQIYAFSVAADEVGGDYYDIYPFANKKKIALAIGDVSGKGTTASFNMAQMKGIFQGLIQLNITVDEFMTLANNAVSVCLEKASFITLSVFIIDLENKTFDYVRAGHCPSLYYSAKKNLFTLLEQKGLGLGILRNGDYKKHIEKQTYAFEGNDLLILYTDGIVEAPNANNEEYGFDRLQDALRQHSQLPPKQLAEAVLEHLYEFTGKKDLNDDYSLIILKFV